MKFKTVSIIYAIALAAEIYAVAVSDERLQYVFKPALMPILLVYYFAGTRRAPPAKHSILAALFLSWLGDVFLLFERGRPAFFILGLGAFLAAHLAYIAYFLQARRINRPAKLPHPLVFAGVAAYTAILFGCLAPHVGGLFYPVAVYALAISVMFAASLAAFDFSRQRFGRMAVAGAALFLASDSILAVNRFAAPFAHAGVLVMLTYGAAQLLITEGSLRNLKKIQP